MKFKLEELQDIKRKAGIYALKKDEEIVYIGKSTNVYLRILEHIVDNKKGFNGYKCLYKDNLTDNEIVETFIIDKLKPKYNRLVVKRKSYFYTLPTIALDKSTVKEYELTEKIVCDLIKLLKNEI